MGKKSAFVFPVGGLLCERERPRMIRLHHTWPDTQTNQLPMSKHADCNILQQAVTTRALKRFARLYALQ